MAEAPTPRMTQIAVADGWIIGLDADGNVWRWVQYNERESNLHPHYVHRWQKLENGI